MSIFEGFGKVPTTTLVSAGVCLAAGGLIGGLIVKKVASAAPPDQMPEKWTKVAQIKELTIYPVKSMRGIPVKEAILDRIGLKAIDCPRHCRDRIFVVIDTDGKCLSQKQLPILTLIQPKIEGDTINLSFVKDSSVNITVDIPTSREGGVEKSALIFGETVKALDCGDKVAEWLSKVCDTTGLRLVYHLSNEPQRSIVPRNVRFHTYRETHTGAFHDETSFMLMSDESVAVVNKELDNPVTVTNFRPTIVVNGIPEPFSEDFWGYIRIGDSGSGPVLKASRPCVRCKLTTVEPDTGEFRTDGEPLRTLYKLKRQVGDDKITKIVSKGAVLGAHFGVFDGDGDVIRVGDTVYAALL